MLTQLSAYDCGLHERVTQCDIRIAYVGECLLILEDEDVTLPQRQAFNMTHSSLQAHIERLRVGRLAGTVHDQGEGEERSVDQREAIEYHFLEDDMPIVIFSRPDPRCSRCMINRLQRQ